ncbi:hypothetical protein O1611_g4288 [Lasiodiplodia mahajangana]|uniref:Uncharacterized protein n=1 Tax=Lasiodiplodia mahajangana TaxID=1108764 RepID=A0ACC2JQ17_9PEZI|nr:hypothetical protein O1611_g4288 [Lasiodiplodia mahajangana]
MVTARPIDGWATANDWANHRPLITALYRDQNKTLKETMRVMEEKHDFFATVRMYKARFQQWGIEKKIKAEDAVEIFRQQTARAKAGKSSVVYIRGRKINPDRLQRYRYRAAAIVSEQILMVERELSSSPSEVSPLASHIVCRTPSPTPEDPPTLSPQLDDPIDFKVPHECMHILGNYVAGSVAAGVWQQASSTAPVPDAFTWAHYVAMSQGLIVHNRTEEGFALLNLCFEQYKSHLMNPDPFFWLATYKAIMLLAHRDDYLGEIFIKYASELTSCMLPSTHPFNRVWARINITGLPGVKQHAAALFESYLNICRGQAGLLPMDQNSLVQMAFVFIQLQCSGMVPYSFTREALGGVMRVLAGSISSQFLLNEAKFRMACLFLEQGKLDEADAVIKEILTWIGSLPYHDRGEFDHLRCKCLWTMFEIEEKKGNIEKASQIGQSLVNLCLSIYGQVHLQTIDAISALASFYTRTHNVDAARNLAVQFDTYWVCFSDIAEDKRGFPHSIEQPWLHRCVELKEDQRAVQQVVDLLERSSWLEESPDTYSE